MGEGWHGEVHYGSRYRLYKEWKNWTKAEAHCQAEGGHLASVTTEEEWQQVKSLASGVAGGVHIGGSYQEEEGVWRWYGGSSWGFTQWNTARGSRGDGYNCLLIYEGGWSDYYCTYMCPFICQTTILPSSQTAQRTHTLEYKMENFFISSFEVNYQYSLGAVHKLCQPKMGGSRPIHPKFATVAGWGPPGVAGGRGQQCPQ